MATVAFWAIQGALLAADIALEATGQETVSSRVLTPIIQGSVIAAKGVELTGKLFLQKFGLIPNDPSQFDAIWDAGQAYRDEQYALRMFNEEGARRIEEAKYASKQSERNLKARRTATAAVSTPETVALAAAAAAAASAKRPVVPVATRSPIQYDNEETLYENEVRRRKTQAATLNNELANTYSTIQTSAARNAARQAQLDANRSLTQQRTARAAADYSKLEQAGQQQVAVVNKFQSETAAAEEAVRQAELRQQQITNQSVKASRPRFLPPSVKLGGSKRSLTARLMAEGLSLSDAKLYIKIFGAD
jgi:hypothetical protein